MFKEWIVHTVQYNTLCSGLYTTIYDLRFTIDGNAGTVAPAWYIYCTAHMDILDVVSCMQVETPLWFLSSSREITLGT